MARTLIRGLVITGLVCAAGVGIPALAAAGPSALAASGKTAAPLRVRSASLTQKGRVLSWSVQLGSPFFFDALERQRRLLCLLIEWPSHGWLRGEVCARAGRGKTGRRLVFRKIAHGLAGTGHTIAGRVTRGGDRQMTVTFFPGEIGLGYRRLRWQVMNTAPGPGCTGQPTGPGRCTSLYPRHGRIAHLHTPRLVGCVARGSSPVFGGPSSRHEIALTFDDGPWNDPPSIDFLRLLERDHVPATFFEIGNQISEFDPTGSLERRMLADGDLIGDHTWTHPDMTRLSASEQRSQLQLTIDAIRRATGFRTCLWRPPYGAYNSGVVSVARSLGLLTIQWDVDPQDWATPGSATIYQRVVSAAHNGAIVLQHFGGGPRSQTLSALPGEISTLRHEGYRFVTLAQMLGVRLIYK